MNVFKRDIDADKAVAVLCRRSLSFFVKEFWSVVVAEELVWNWHMDVLCDEMQEIISSIFRQKLQNNTYIRADKKHDMVINIPPGTSKPVWEEMPVLMGDGTYRLLKEIQEGDYVIGKTGNPCKVSAVHVQGELPCVDIKTFGGRSIITAHDHPILTADGWVNAGQIIPEYQLALLHKPNIASTTDKEIADFKLAGYIIGDGSCSGGNCSLTNKDPEYIEDFVECATSLGFATNTVLTKNGVYRISLKRPFQGKSNVNKYKGMGRGYKDKTGPRKWLEDVGLLGKTSKTKEVPDFVWKGTDKQIAAFLTTYFHCDGTVSFRHAGKRNLVVSVTSISKKLALGIQRLFLRLGVSMRIRTRIAKSGFAYNRNLLNYEYYTVETTEQDAASRFLKIIPLSGPKRRKLEEFKPFTRTFEQQYLPDEVQTVTDAGVLPCRCLSVEDDASFVVDGVVVHNSSICTVMAPAWAWCNDPTIRIISGSYSGDLATEHSQKSRDIIESDKYRRYFPHIRLKGDKAGKTNYENTLLGQRYSCGVGGAVTGVHAHLIIIDDPLNPKQAASVAETETANTWMDATLSMRKVDKAVTPTILVMQRLATNDCTGHILSKGKNVRHICLPAEDGPQVAPSSLRLNYIGGLLDNSRLGWSVLADAKKDLGGYGYAGQMLQEPTPAGGLIWQKWFREIPDEQFPTMDECSQVGTDWDTAYTEKDSNAASAYVTAGKRGKDCYIFDLGFDWLEMPELVKWMRTLKAPHYVENKASGSSVKQILQRSGVVALEVPVKGGADKVARARNATPPVEAGFWYIRKSLADKLYNDPKQGILRFPKGQYKDLADALAQCVQRLSGPGLVIGTAAEKKPAASLVSSRS